jgi:hypothetical protein
LEHGARPYTSPTFGWQTAMGDAHAMGRRWRATPSVDWRIAR